MEKLRHTVTRTHRHIDNLSMNLMRKSRNIIKGDLLRFVLRIPYNRHHAYCAVSREAIIIGS